MGITACLRNLEQKVLISEDQNLCYELGLFDFDENPYSPPPQIFRYSLCSKAFKKCFLFYRGTQKGSDFRDDCTELILHVSLYS